MTDRQKADRGERVEPCGECGGYGMVPTLLGGIIRGWTPCEDCDGRAYVRPDPEGGPE